MSLSRKKKVCTPGLPNVIEGSILERRELCTVPFLRKVYAPNDSNNQTLIALYLSTWQRPLFWMCSICLDIPPQLISIFGFLVGRGLLRGAQWSEACIQSHADMEPIGEVIETQITDLDDCFAVDRSR